MGRKTKYNNKEKKVEARKKQQMEYYERKKRPSVGEIVNEGGGKKRVEMINNFAKKMVKEIECEEDLEKKRELISSVKDLRAYALANAKTTLELLFKPLRDDILDILKSKEGKYAKESISSSYFYTASYINSAEPYKYAITASYFSSSSGYNDGSSSYNISASCASGSNIKIEEKEEECRGENDEDGGDVLSDIDLEELLDQLKNEADDEEEEDDPDKKNVRLKDMEMEKCGDIYNYIKKSQDEVNLLNMKLNYTTKIINNYKITDQNAMVKIVELFDLALDVRDVKMLYSAFVQAMILKGG